MPPKESKYDYFAIREVFGDDIPFLTVDLQSGREANRKKALSDAIAALLKTELNVEPVDVYALYRENLAENHYCGGTPPPAWVPASDL